MARPAGGHASGRTGPRESTRRSESHIPRKRRDFELFEFDDGDLGTENPSDRVHGLSQLGELGFADQPEFRFRLVPPNERADTGYAAILGPGETVIASQAASATSQNDAVKPPTIGFPGQKGAIQ
jgi:hypothetical protein